MKNSIITRYASFLLVIGFFISCSGSKFSAENLINEGNYQQALTEISAEIDKNPSSFLFYQKGKVYGLIAKDSPVQDRETNYYNMSSSFDSIRVYQTASPETNWQAEADSLANYYWEMEHTNGLQSYKEGSVEDTQKAISHFRNAIAIEPENIESYKSLSIAQYNSSDVEGAIETLKMTESLETVSLDVFENLGFLYLETGNPEQSIFYYKKADQDPLKNKNVAFGLVNAYISQDRNSEAVSFLSNLVEEFPNDPKLRNVYGTQLYEQVSELFSNLRASYADSDTTSVTNLGVEIEGVSENAENELIKAYQIESSNIEFIESLAVFYNNMAGNYFSVHQDAFDDDKNSIAEKALALTDFSITYYEKLQELNTGNNSYSDKIENLKSLKESWNNQ